MNAKDKDILLDLLHQYDELGISQQIDYNKFYLYSIITHSTAIEGSTVTEVEAQLLFDEGITSSKRTMMEQMMNLDLKMAYEYGMTWIRSHAPITTEWLITLASKVMARTGSEYNSLSGHFDASKGELRKLNVTAGFGGRSYMSFQKVPGKLAAFCEELNRRRQAIDANDIAGIYEMSFWAHYELVTIHPWADGNGRTCRLLMNLLQIELGVLPTKVLKEDKEEYIQALIDTREKEDIDIFIDCMTELHCRHLKSDIDQYLNSTTEKMVDNPAFAKKMVDKKAFVKKMADNWPIKPSLAEKLVDILMLMTEKQNITTDEVISEFGFTATTAKRYMRQLTEYGYIEAHGGNRNRSYSIITTLQQVHSNKH